MTERPPDPSRTPSDVRRTFFDRRLLTKRAATAAFVAVLMISLVAPTAAQTDHIALRRQAAEQGDVKSQLALGLMYANGSNVPQDYAEAAKWLRKAADQGNSQAQYELGLLYVKGQGGLPRDEAEAMRLFRSAADQGDPNSQRLLGTMADFQNNYAEAVKWYRKGADEGDPGSQEFLGILYKEGRGVPQDYVKRTSGSILQPHISPIEMGATRQSRTANGLLGK